MTSWTALLLLSVLSADSGVWARALDSREASGSAAAHRGRCAELAAPWTEDTRRTPEDAGTVLQLRVRPFSSRGSRGPVFPGRTLFSFVRRVYLCCQEGLTCTSVRGIQGRLRADTDVEFLLTREILSLTVMRAELHLQLSNPQHLDIHPVLSSMAKRDLPTRYSVWSRGNTVELRVDLLFLFQSLQEATGGAGGGPSLANMRRVVFSSRGDPPGERSLQDTDGELWGDGVANALPALDLGLVLGCSQAGSTVSCGAGGVHLSHTPFMALYYR